MGDRVKGGALLPFRSPRTRGKPSTFEELVPAARPMEDLSDEALVAACATGDTAALAAQGEMMERLSAALDALPHDLRVAFVLCDVEEVPGVEAARALGVRQGTMWRRLHDARKRLRDMLGGRPSHEGSSP